MNDRQRVRFHLIATGQCIGLLPRSVAHRTERVGLKVLPLRLANQQPAVGVITIKNRTLSPLASLFLARVRRVVGDFQRAQGDGRLDCGKRMR
jgi:DNA-binding transcriptional LysR family regulator